MVPDQSYYWTVAWQADEQLSVAELERGEGRLFEDSADAIKWLLTKENAFAKNSCFFRDRD